MTASGPQCVRNRYYDSATGLSTQPDPIGLAGGLNLYRFAAGDPINASDPFGLDVVPKDEQSKRIWRRLQREALAMKMSKDENVSDAGQALLDMFHDFRHQGA